MDDDYSLEMANCLDYSQSHPDGPSLIITEQPKQRGFRFRYGCEGPSHGGVPGASSEKNRKTYPSVKIINYCGNAKIVVSLVTNNKPHMCHAHSLVGKHCTEEGTCVVSVGPKDMTAQFANLGILHVTKRNVPKVLLRRFLGPTESDPAATKTPVRKNSQDEKLQQLKKESENLAKTMDLSVVRLQFTAYLPDSTGLYTLELKPVISDPIFDSKAPNASNLRIVRMDKTFGCVTGGEEIYLLCDKVQKEDIQVRFYEGNAESDWEAFGEFGPTDVHRQFAIVFRTPCYRDTNIRKPVSVYVQLRRRLQVECSEPTAFTYCPKFKEREEIYRRKKGVQLPNFQDHFGGSPPSWGSNMYSRGGGLGYGFGGYLDMYPSNQQYGSQHMAGSHGGGSHLAHQPREQTASGSELPEPGPQEVQASERGNKAATRETQPGLPQGSGPARRRQLSQQEYFLRLRALQITERTALALQDYAITGDARMLLAVQRHLTAVQDDNGDTSLHLAIIHQQPLVAQQLLQVIISIPGQNFINAPNNLRQTPLHVGVITQQHSLVDLLLSAGADAAILDRHGNSVLHLALHQEDEAMVRSLVDGLEPHVLKKLLKLPDFNGLYPLHLAVKARSQQLVELLVNKGADSNQADQKSGRTALHLAVEMNCLGLAGYFLAEAGAEVDLATFEGNTALHLAAGSGSPALTAMLLAAGADRNAENYEPVLDSDEESELDQAICRGHTPLDIASSAKVRDILLGETWARKEPEETKIQRGNIASLGSEALSELNQVLNKDESGADWMKLADRLNLGSLIAIFKSAESPSKSLLDNYDLSGGTVVQLANALQALGLEEAVNVIQKTEIHGKLQSSDGKQSVDSAYGSGPSQGTVDCEEGLKPPTPTPAPQQPV
ncbi:nuclear factor NF-kappa-B p100 subunit isoform X1 [Callorhinchus milii]|nr:nuclear factor NF-kappa-B p100 subunit isoform X1 [Callorhinchus milii]XP_007897341.2 nuclear factor NF-kappa-B p100 subunit isoform X1 [Callorhinchus milii]